MFDSYDQYDQRDLNIATRRGQILVNSCSLRNRLINNINNNNAGDWNCLHEGSHGFLIQPDETFFYRSILPID
jgi:hypothetical protein